MSRPADEAPAVELDRVTRTFASGGAEAGHRGARRCMAVDELSLDVAHGEVMGLLGPNGAGKSTVIGMMSGLVTPSSGRVRIEGFDAVSERSRIAGRVGVVFDGARTLYPRMTPRENIQYFCALRRMGGAARVVSSAQRWIDFFDIGRWADVPVSNLSMGTRQKASLAVALAFDPRVILMDEPTLGLDVRSSLDLQELIRSMARDRGCAVIIATHQMDVAQHVCDRVCIMNNGKALAVDTVGALLRLFGLRSYRIELRKPLTHEARRMLREACSGSLDFRETDSTDSTGDFVVDIGLDDASGLLPAMAALQAAGAEVESVVRREPCLADAFLEITGAAKEGRTGVACALVRGEARPVEANPKSA